MEPSVAEIIDKPQRLIYVTASASDVSEQAMRTAELNGGTNYFPQIAALIHKFILSTNLFLISIHMKIMLGLG